MMSGLLESGSVLPAVVAAGGLALLVGCATPVGPGLASSPAVITAIFAQQSVKVDGVLDEDVWKTAPVYQLSTSLDRMADGMGLSEPGEALFAWDENYFYVAIKFYDSDIVAEGEEDQLYHFTMGDVMELFLKPEGETWFWELYATPRGKKTSLWFPGRGRMWLESCFQYSCGLRAAAWCEGTLNDWRDRDSFWTAEMAMPIKDLTARGETFCPGARWRILVGRYNYSRYLPWRETSMTPAISRMDFNRYEDYGVLELIK